MIVRASRKLGGTWPRGCRNGRRRSRSFVIGSRRRSRRRSRSCGFLASIIFGMRSTNMLERLNEEIKRRTKVVRIFPDARSCLRLVRALCAETHERLDGGRRPLPGHGSSSGAASGRPAEAGGMTGAPFAFGDFARVNSPKARPAWKACGQSLPALSARVLLRAGIDHILSTLSAPRRSANMPARRRSG